MNLKQLCPTRRIRRWGAFLPMALMALVSMTGTVMAAAEAEAVTETTKGGSGHQ